MVSGRVSLMASRELAFMLLLFQLEGLGAGIGLDGGTGLGLLGGLSASITPLEQDKRLGKEHTHNVNMHQEVQRTH